MNRHAMTDSQAATSDDPIWESIRREVAEDTASEPLLASFYYSVVLNHRRLEDALSYILAAKLESSILPATSLRDLIDEALARDPAIGVSVRADIEAVVTRDPACRGYSVPLLFFKGFHALQSYRVGHYYWNSGRKPLALYLQSRVSEVFAVDIHPAATIGHGILIDHATGVVIGETSVVGNNVSFLHDVTLGGTGKERGDRHPKVEEGVLLSAGAKVFGNLKIGKEAKVAGGAVVLHDVPAHSTVAGVPARVVGVGSTAKPAFEMNQHLAADEEMNFYGAGI